MRVFQNILTTAILFLANFILAQSYCDEEAFFTTISSTSTVFSEPIPYCIDCPNEEGFPVTCNILLHRPVDDLNAAIPRRPHIMYVHGYAPNSELHDPFSIFAAALMRDEFAYYGFSASALQYRQDIKGFQANVCAIPVEEVIKTHYRAIQDVRKAVDVLFQNAEEYGIDTSNFILSGNSQGGMAVMHAALVDNEQEWLTGQFSDYQYLIQELGPWAPKHHIKAVISTSAGLYDLNFLDAHDSTALFLAHGVCDITVPFETGTYFNCPSDIEINGSFAIACRANEVKAPLSMHVINGMGHDWPEEFVDASYPMMRDWLKNQILCGEPSVEAFIYFAGDVSCDTVTIDNECLSTSVASPVIKSETLFFPNPSSGRLFLLPEQIEGLAETHFHIYTVSGRFVGIATLHNQNYLDLSHIPGGSYIMTWPGISGVIHHQQVILH